MGNLTERINQAAIDVANPRSKVEGFGLVDDREKAIIDRHKSELPGGGLMQKIATGRAGLEIDTRRQQRDYAEKAPPEIAEPVKEMLSNLGDRGKVLDTYRKLTPEQRQEALKLAPGISQQLGDDRGGVVGRTLGAVSRGISHGVSQPIQELVGAGGTPEEIAAIRQLDSAASQEFNPSRPSDPWYQRGPLQATEMAPWMATVVGGAGLGRAAATGVAGRIATSAAAGNKVAGAVQAAGQAVGKLPQAVAAKVGIKGVPAVTAGKVGELAGITAAAFPGQYAQEVDSLKALGMVDDTRLRLLAGGTAAITGLVEGLVPNPFKAGNVSLTEGATKAARQYLWNAAKNAPGELTEEYLQGVTSGLGEHVAQYIGSEVDGKNPVKKKSLEDAFSKGWEQMKEAALPMAFLLGVPAVGGAGLAAARAGQATPPSGLPPTSPPPLPSQPQNRDTVSQNSQVPPTQPPALPAVAPIDQATPTTPVPVDRVAQLQKIMSKGYVAVEDGIAGESRKDRWANAKAELEQLDERYTQPKAVTDQSGTESQYAQELARRRAEKAGTQPPIAPAATQDTVRDIVSPTEPPKSQEPAVSPVTKAYMEAEAAGEYRTPKKVRTADETEKTVNYFRDIFKDAVAKGVQATPFVAPGTKRQAFFESLANEAGGTLQWSDMGQGTVSGKFVKQEKPASAPQAQPATPVVAPPATPPTPKSQGVKPVEQPTPATTSEPTSKATVPVKPEWDVIQDTSPRGGGKFYRVDPNPKLTPAERRDTRQEVDQSDGVVVLPTRDQWFKPIPEPTRKAQKDFIDGAKEGATFDIKGFETSGPYKVVDGGAILDTNSGRQMGTVQSRAILVEPGMILNPSWEVSSEVQKQAEAKPTEKVPPVAPAKKAIRETITPAEDTPVGRNNANEALYERADGSRYRMRNDRKDHPQGYPDFGGDLAPTEPSTKKAGKKEQAAPTPPRAMEPTEEGRPSDGKPVMPGDRFLTNTKRKTTPYPKYDGSTNRKAIAGEKKSQEWLMENAIAEAESRGDEFNARTFRSELEDAKNGKLPQASKDSATLYVFGDHIPKVPKPFLKDIPKQPEAKSRDTVSQNPKTNQENKDAPQTEKGGDPNGKVETKTKTEAQAQANGRKDVLGDKEDKAAGEAPSSDSSNYEWKKGNNGIEAKGFDGYIRLVPAKDQMSMDGPAQDVYWISAPTENSSSPSPQNGTHYSSLDKAKNALIKANEKHGKKKPQEKTVAELLGESDEENNQEAVDTPPAKPKAAEQPAKEEPPAKKPPELQSPAEYRATLAKPTIKAIDLSTNQLADMEIEHNVIEAILVDGHTKNSVLTQERRVSGQLKQLLDCLGK